MTEEEKNALKVMNARTKRLLDEFKIEKEDMSDEPKIAYLMQEIRANKTILNLIEKLQKENEQLKEINEELSENKLLQDINIKKNFISKQKIKDKIEEIKQEKKKYGNCLIEMYEDELVNRDIKILQELLESEDSKDGENKKSTNTIRNSRT